MLVYRDRSFCVQDDCIKRFECEHYFTEKHKKRAEELKLHTSTYLETTCYKPEKKQ
jgi:hypothetical protein